MDVAKLRVPFRSGGSLYDFETGICFVDTDKLEGGGVVDPAVEVEFEHETAHWLTEAISPIGQFLAFIKAAKGVDLVHAAPGDTDLRSRLRRKMEAGDMQSHAPIYSRWSSFDEWPDEFGRLDIVIERMLLDVRADAVLCHGHTIVATPESRLAVLAHAMGRYSEWLNTFPLVKNESYMQPQLEKFVENSLRSGFFTVNPVYRGHPYTTIDLIEAVAFCREVIWAKKHGIVDLYLPARLEKLSGTGYIAPVVEILYGLGELTTAGTIAANILRITIIICAALNPPLPPIESPDYDRYAWEHVFPPLRFLLFFQNADKHFKKGWRLTRCGGAAFDDDAHAFQELVYKTMDPPNRSFRVHVLENSVFDSFNALPNQHCLNEHGLWMCKGRLLHPYDLRLSAAFQLKMALSELGIHTMEEALFHGDLKSVTRYCVPVATIRTGNFAPSDVTVPVNSQLLQGSEVVSWFLHHTAVQTSGLDFLFRQGPVEFGAYLEVLPQISPAWTKEIGTRARALWTGLLSQ